MLRARDRQASPNSPSPSGARGAPRRFAAVTAVTVALLAIGVGPAPAVAPPPAGFADLVDRLLPAVVNISTVQTSEKRNEDQPSPPSPNLPPGSAFEEFFRQFFDRQRPTTSLGSGFIISTSGYIVTNNHVVEEADEITVTLQDETRLTAEVVGRDAKTDLALLKVKASGDLPTVTFGDSSKLRVGDWVVAIGNPFGLGGTVTAGIVSGRQRDIRAGPYDDFIQTDASINQGNSGGPMFNVAGEVVGINTAILAPAGHSVGVGFAIPSNLAGPILEQLEKFGRARRGWLGVQIQTVTEEIARALGLPEASGALVAAVTADGPAEEHGIKVGDVILRFDGRDVGKMRRLPRLVAETAAGKSVAVEVWRDRGPRSITVVLGEFPDDDVRTAARTATGVAARSVKITELGFTVSLLTPELRKKFELDVAAEGVVVTAVAKNGPAARKAIVPGTIIRKIGPDQRTVETPSEIAGVARDVGKAGQTTVLLFVELRGTQRFVALEIDRG